MTRRKKSAGLIGGEFTVEDLFPLSCDEILGKSAQRSEPLTLSALEERVRDGVAEVFPEIQGREAEISGRRASTLDEIAENCIPTYYSDTLSVVAQATWLLIDKPEPGLAGDNPSAQDIIHILLYEHLRDIVQEEFDRLAEESEEEEVEEEEVEEEEPEPEPEEDPSAEDRYFESQLKRSRTRKSLPEHWRVN